MSFSKILRRKELLLVNQELQVSTWALTIKSAADTKTHPETKTLVFNVKTEQFVEHVASVTIN